MPLGLSPKALLGAIAGFLLLVALFVHPAGPVETTRSQIEHAARKNAAPAAAAASARPTMPRAWYAPDAAAPQVPPARQSPPVVPASDPQPIYLDPPPQGADFPPDHP